MKKKILVFTLPAYGHSKEPGIVANTLSELYDVTVFTTPKYKDFYSSAKTLFYTIDEEKIHFSQGPINLAKDLITISNEIVSKHDFEAIIKDFDFVLYDVQVRFVHDIVLKLNKNAISYAVSYSQNTFSFLPASLHAASLQYFFQAFGEGKNLFLEDRKLAVDVFNKIVPSYSKNHIALIPEFLQPKLQKNKNHFYGSAILESADYKENNSQDYVYVALGSIYVNKNILEQIIKAIISLGASGAVAAGKYKDELMHLETDKLKIVSFANQEMELQKATLFITHAGTNSVLEAIKYSAPMLCLPQAADQFAFAAKVESLGIGHYPFCMPQSSIIFAKIIKKMLAQNKYTDSYKKLYKKYNFSKNKTIEYITKTFQ
jgi:UDP:flavonoid glycosyltransferase YjiC (YdhE family)